MDSSVASLTGLRVLLVVADEDESAGYSVVLGVLGAEVRAATSAEEALALVGVWPPDVLICDATLSDEDGRAFIGAARAAQRTHRTQVPAVALANLAEVGDWDAMIWSGFDGYFAKPVALGQLAQALACLPRAARAMAS